MKNYIAFSGGVESTAMCILYGKGATAVFTDTGSEHEYLYSRIDEVEAAIKELHNGDFEIIRLRASVKVGDKYVDNLTDYIRKHKFFPSPRVRFCTRLFKIEPMDKYLANKGDCNLMIGLNAEEERVGNFGLSPNVNYKYPLQDAGITRAQCVEILQAHNLAPNFPAYMRRGGCVFCPFKSKKEFAAMVHLSYSEISLVRELEESIQDERGKYFRIRSNMPSMREFIEAEVNNLLGDLAPYYDDSEETYSCGVFCHR